jgi:hypothetical protein
MADVPKVNAATAADNVTTRENMSTPQSTMNFRAT